MPDGGRVRLPKPKQRGPSSASAPRRTNAGRVLLGEDGEHFPLAADSDESAKFDRPSHRLTRQGCSFDRCRVQFLVIARATYSGDEELAAGAAALDAGMQRVAAALAQVAPLG